MLWFTAMQRQQQREIQLSWATDSYPRKYLLYSVISDLWKVDSIHMKMKAVWTLLHGSLIVKDRASIARHMREPEVAFFFNFFFVSLFIFYIYLFSLISFRFTAISTVSFQFPQYSLLLGAPLTSATWGRWNIARTLETCGVCYQEKRKKVHVYLLLLYFKLALRFALYFFIYP